MTDPISDTICRCPVCGSEVRIHLASSLQQGWPRCHDQDMQIVSTQADIAHSVDLAVHPIIQRAAQAMRAAIETKR